MVPLIVAFGVAVALNVTGEPASPLALAVAVLLLVPAVVPRVHVTEAWPLAAVVAVAADKLPPPAVVVHETATPATPATPAPDELVTRTTSGWPSAWPAGPAWLLPDTNAIAAGVAGGLVLSLAHANARARGARRTAFAIVRPTERADGMTASDERRTQAPIMTTAGEPE